MAHHVLRRLLRKKRFILGNPVDGANVDPSLNRIYVLSEAGATYFSRVDGISVDNWPDDIRVLADADPIMFAKIDGLDVADWPDDLRILKDAGTMFYAMIDGIDVNPWPETIRVMDGVAQIFGESLDGIALKRYVMDFPRIMKEVGPIYGGTIRGAELGYPSILRVDMAPNFQTFRLPYYDAIELKTIINDMMIMPDAGNIRGGILRGPELGNPSQNRVALAIAFNGMLLPYHDGIIVKDFVDSNYIMLDAGPIRAGILRGPELGDPSQLRAQVTPFFRELQLPDGESILVKETVNDMLVSSLFDPFRGGVFRGKEIGEPSSLRINVYFNSPPFLLMPQDDWLTSPVNPKTITDEEMFIGPLDDVPISPTTVFAASQPTVLSLLEGFGTDFERETRAYDTMYASAPGSTNLINSFTDADPLLKIIDYEFTAGVDVSLSTKRIRVTKEMGTAYSL